MAFYQFKQSGNRLYVDLIHYQQDMKLREFINNINSNRPGTFTIDMIQRRIWFYPPDNYVMPTLNPKIAGPDARKPAKPGEVTIYSV